jgi:hypothetical protein
MSPSRNRYSRAQIRARTRKNRPGRSSGLFYALIAVIVIGGSVGLALASSESHSNSAASGGTPPQAGDPTSGTPGDHWHTAFGVNICGQWLPNPPTFETAADNPNVRVGIHTHGDGYIHIHPFTSSEAGHHATLGLFLSYGGWSVSDTSISTWTGPDANPGKKDWSNGDKCPPGTPDAGRTGVIRWAIDCRARTGNPGDYRLKDQQVLAVAFIPKTDAVPVTPNAAVAPATDGSGAGPVATSTCKPSSVNNPGVLPAGGLSPSTSSTTSTPPSS